MKLVYTVVTDEEDLEHLMGFKEKWGRQYPSCVKRWEENWDIVLTQLEIIFQGRRSASFGCAK